MSLAFRGGKATISREVPSDPVPSGPWFGKTEPSGGSLAGIATSGACFDAFTRLGRMGTVAPFGAIPNRTHLPQGVGSDGIQVDFASARFAL